MSNIGIARYPVTQQRSESRGSSELKKICRVCLKKSTDEALLTMSSTSKVQFCQVFGIEVDSDRVYKVCVSCLNFIKEAAMFRKMAKKADAYVKSVINGERAQQQQQQQQPAEVEDYTQDSDELGVIDEPVGEYILGDDMKLEHENFSRRIELVPVQYEQQEEYDEDIYRQQAPPPPPQQQQPMYTCSICHREFGRKRLLDRHRATRHTINHSQVPAISTTTTTLSKSGGIMMNNKYPSMTNHTMNNNNAENPLLTTPTVFKPKKVSNGWSCCGRVYPTRKILQGHKSRSHRDQIARVPQNCGICGRRFADQSSLYQHKRNAHNGDTVGLTCEYCGRTMTSAGSMRKHKRTVHPEHFEI